ncbi:hypothetical protein G7054_g12436 [Neopestalotiopsis clavispora]|nr:hypothetical protein G7054_g12436 [Neopestalotiopsis clavispora]
MGDLNFSCGKMSFVRRCKLRFSGENDLQLDQQEDPECILDEKGSYQWLDERQKRQLSERLPRERGPEKAWRKLYQMLFPEVDDCDVPDPYHESNEAALKLVGRQLWEEERRNEQEKRGSQPPVPTASPAAKVPLMLELSDPKQTREDEIPYTDSGYESARGLGYPSMNEEDTQETDQIENGHALVTGEMDGNNGNTSYSVATAILPEIVERCVVDICNDINSRLQGSVSKETFKSLSKILPDLIKAFAVKIGSDVPYQSNLRVMHLVHKYHKYIVSHLQNEFQVDQSESGSPRKSVDVMPLNEIMSMWRESDNREVVVVDPSECFQGLSDDADDEDGEFGDEERDLPALSGYSKMIMNSAAYDWLISSLVKEASFHWGDAQPRTMVDEIRQEILSQLPTGRISSKHPPTKHTVSFKIPRSSLLPLSDNLRASPNRNSAIAIADQIVAISSSAAHVQISSVSQYMEQTWSSGGSALLSVLQSFINGSEQAIISCNFDNSVNIELAVKGPYIEVIVTGTSYSIAGYGEQLAWLTSALQPRVCDHAIYVTPFIRRINEHTPETRDIPSWVIEHFREELHGTDTIARSIQEWQSQSGSPVIVRGFPTLSRPEDCPGIEVPPQLPASVLPSPLGGRNATRVLLKTTGKLLQLFDHAKGVAIWHTIKSPMDACACRRRFMRDDDKDIHPCIDSVELSQHRHIITECSVSEMYYQNTDPEIKPDIGSTEFTQRECSLSESPQFTPYSENITDSSDSLDVNMLSIPDSSEYGASGPPDLDDATLAVMEVVASRLVSEYRQCTEQHNLENACSSNTKQCNPGGQWSFPTHGSSHSTLGPTSTQASSTNSIGKRAAEQDDGDGDGDSQRGPPQKIPKKDNSGKSKMIFACPFWKQNSVEHWSCFGKRLDKICYVKQHLVRKHKPKFRCDRCLAIFKDEGLKLIHLESEQCMFERNRFGIITSETRDKLSEKPPAGLNEREQWFLVWRILFTDLSPPSSPYLDTKISEDLNRFWEISERRAPSIFIETFQEAGLLIPGDSDLETLFRRAVTRAIAMLYGRPQVDQIATSQNSTSEGSSSAIPSGHQGDERRSALVPMYEELSSNADSGVELRSQPSSSLEDTDLPPCIPVRSRPPSDGRINAGSYGTANLGVHVADLPDNGTNSPQLFVHPPSVDGGNNDFLYQPLGNQPDPGPLYHDFGEHWDAELRSFAENMKDDHV